jgi:plasmid stabilization system protein ParE
MLESKYILRYLPKYVEDLNAIVDYIVLKLHSPESATNLVNKIEKAILERSYCPLSFEPFKSNRKRKHQYYKIYVDNFVVYYVVIDNIMEVRRILYKSRDADRVIE